MPTAHSSHSNLKMRTMVVGLRTRRVYDAADAQPDTTRTPLSARCPTSWQSCEEPRGGFLNASRVLESEHTCSHGERLQIQQSTHSSEARVSTLGNLGCLGGTAEVPGNASEWKRSGDILMLSRRQASSSTIGGLCPPEPDDWDWLVCLGVHCSLEKSGRPFTGPGAVFESSQAVPPSY